MAVLGKVNFVGQQRVDIADILGMESFTSADFRSIISAFTDVDTTYIVRGLEVVSKNGLNVGISVSNCMIMNPLDNSGSFYVGLADDPDESIELPASQTNIFVEAVFTNVTANPINRSLWDSLSQAGEDASGQEFTAAIDFQNILQLQISVNTSGFSEGAVPLFRASTSADAVTSFTDSRNLLFRLGTGGTNPDPLHKYPWSPTRSESVATGTGVGNAADSPWRSSDASGSINDKAFRSLKDWADAVMTRISEISGSSIWYQSAGGTGSGATNVTLQQLFFDTIGHSLQPDKNAAFKWRRKISTAVAANVFNTSGTVQVTLADHRLVAGQQIIVTTATDIGGILAAQLTGTFTVTSVIDENTFEYLSTGAATSTVAGTLDKIESGYRLISEGTEILNGVTGQYHNGLIKWQANQTGLIWELGGKFVNDTPGGSRNYLSTGLRFESQQVADGGNIYLFLEREVSKGSGANLSWGTTTGTSGYPASESVLGNPGDFTGIALGDYIRKESGGFNTYFKVIAMTDATNTFPKDILTTLDQGFVADATYVTLRLQAVIDPSSTNIAISNEPLVFFRSRYSSDDVVADTTVVSQGVVYTFQNTNFYWLGRRDESLFFLRDYGTVQEGEEVTTLDAVYAHGNRGDGDSSVIIEHAKEAVYDSTNGYALKTGVGNLVTLRKRRRDNTTSTPSDGDNSGSLLSYTINTATLAPGTIADGSQLWVRLSDTTSGELVSGSVTNDSDDQDNTDITTNVWEVRTPVNAPAKTFDNIDVFLLAYKDNINGQDALIFSDGTVLTNFGQMIHTNLDISGEVRLNDYDDTAIPFIEQSGTKLLDQDTSNFFYNKTTGIAGIRTFRVADNDISQSIPEDVSLLSNLGAHTATIGQASSTIRIPGDLVVEGDSFGSYTEVLQSDDKLITLGVGNLLDTGNGSGIEVADDTRTTTQIDSTNTQSDVTLTYGANHDYSLADIVGVAATEDVGGITAGQISGMYTVVATATVAGEAEILTPTTLKIITSGTATSTASSTTTPPRTYTSPSSIRMSSSAAVYTAMTSWAFRVKGVATAPTITPVQDYGVVPTAHSANMVEQRIPFTGGDNAGPGDDSTLDFTNNLRWNNSTNTLVMTGTYSIEGSIIPQTDNLHDLGTDALRWRKLYLNSTLTGGLEIGDSNLYETSANRLKTDDELETAEYIVSGRMTQIANTSATTGPTPLPPANSLNIFQRDGLVYSQNSTGTQKLLTNSEAGNIYHQVARATAAPANNSETPTVTSTPTTISIPLDENFNLSSAAPASTDGSTATVTVDINGHGLITGNTVTISITSSIGGISANDLSGSFTVTVTSADQFTYTALAASTLVDNGFLERVVHTRARSYLVGSNELEIYRNYTKLVKGTHYNELGTEFTLSTQIEWLVPISEDDQIEFRIDANGGQVLIQQGGTPSLQGAYDLGNSITTTGLPVVITNPTPSVYKALQINGDLGVTGVIDPTAVELTSVAANPMSGGAGKTGIWANSTTLDLIYERDGQPAINMTADFLRRDGTFAMTANLNMDGKELVNLAAPTSDNSAARRIFVTDLDALNLRLDGSRPMTSDLDMNSNKVANLGAPTAATDAARLSEVNAVAAMLVDYLLLSGGTMAGGINMGGNAISNIPDTPGGVNHAVNQTYVTSQINTRLPLAGGTMAGTLNMDSNTINMGSGRITDLLDPTDPQHPATQNYVLALDRYKATYFTGTNNTGALITAGSVVILSGTVSGEIELANAGNINTAEGTVGVLVDDIANAASGFVQVTGLATVSGSSAFSLRKRVYLSLNSGEGTSTAPTVTGTVRLTLGNAYSSTQVILAPVFEGVVGGIYEESYTVVNGAPANDDEITGPITAGTSITIPKDSRNGDVQKTYIVGEAQLTVSRDGVSFDPTELTEVGAPGSVSQQVQLSENIQVGDILTFRISAGANIPATVSGAETLQSVYNAGRFIATTSGNPVEVSGPAGETLLDIAGELTARAVSFVQQAADPFTGVKSGIYVDTNDDLIQRRSGGSTLNISQIASGAIPDALENKLLNNTGSTLTKALPVSINSLGELVTADHSSLANCRNIAGLVTSSIIDTQKGNVTTSGRLLNVTTTMAFGDTVYLSSSDGLIGTSQLTGDEPATGSEGFVAGDQVVKIGIVVQNDTVPTNKDIIVDVQWIKELV